MHSLMSCSETLFTKFCQEKCARTKGKVDNKLHNFHRIQLNQNMCKYFFQNRFTLQNLQAFRIVPSRYYCRRRPIVNKTERSKEDLPFFMNFFSKTTI